MEKRLRIIFMGTPEFAVPSLSATAALPYDLVAVITRPDARKGRGLQISECPIKVMAKTLGLPILQPHDLKDPPFLDELKTLDPDLLVVVAFKILPREILDIPRIGSVNLHPSLLPKYRGAAPIPWAIAKGETVTGLSIFLLNQIIDGGDLLSQSEEPILPHETGGELSDRLKVLGASRLAECITTIARGEHQKRPQGEISPCPAPKLRKEDGRMDFTLSSNEVYNRFRAFTPAPGPFTFFKGTRINILGAETVSGDTTKKAGCVVAVSPTAIQVQTGQGIIALTRFKPEGRKEISARDFLNGFRVTDRDSFDE